ncbi:MAG: 3-dehydroquinate synthase [Candidatus Delongbacteria bacterium]
MSKTPDKEKRSAADEIRYFVSGKEVIFITDKKVYKLYCTSLMTDDRTIVIPAGERSKNLRTVERIYAKLIQFRADKNTVIVGIGGGVVCDIAGFAASTYKRGTGLILVPTTLLAQVDASLGGKNGVNFKNYKNVVGTFKEPDRVIVDSSLLKTLDRKNFNNGVAELIKTALITGGELFEKISRLPVTKMKDNELAEIISTAGKLKSDIVSADPYDRGLRKILNFGHTFGHAAEMSMSGLLHGEAVSVGMMFACVISEKTTGLDRKETEKIQKMLISNGLPVKLPCEISVQSVMDSVYQDKKKNIDKIDMILLKRIGEPVIKNISINQLKGYLDDFCKHI